MVPLAVMSLFPVEASNLFSLMVPGLKTMAASEITIGLTKSSEAYLKPLIFRFPLLFIRWYALFSMASISKLAASLAVSIPVKSVSKSIG